MAEPPRVLLLLLLFFLQGVETSSKVDAVYMHRLAAASGADRQLGWDPNSEPCTWSGVQCDDDRVVTIEARGKGLSGWLPDAENDSISQLQRMDLGGNKFTGPLPLLDLPQLYSLHLDGNEFTSMPQRASFFVGVRRLEYLEMSNNTMLSGWNLTDLGFLKLLHKLNASNASVYGTLDSFRDSRAFPLLQSVSLANNKLSGPVPEAFGSSSKQLMKLDLSNNGLSGSISFVSNMALSIVDLRLHNNNFVGALPDFKEFKSLTFLSLDHNRLTGIVPASLFRLPGILSVYLSGNLLQGPLPEFESWVHTDVTEAATKGSFCRLDRGPCEPEVESLLLIAAAFGSPQILAERWMRNDACAGWIGVHCSDGTGGRRRVTGINLSRLGLSGTLDSAFGSLLSLEVLVISGNNIAGQVPASLTKLPSLRYLDVANNALVGTLPRFRRCVLVWAEGNRELNVSSSSVSSSSMSAGVFVAGVVTLAFFYV